ncbi:MAG: hypothetical protein HY690_16645 [Chloroflexi bacterium]|nr:hypothetical protein [Chloroflexota bacterium]
MLHRPALPLLCRLLALGLGGALAVASLLLPVAGHWPERVEVVRPAAADLGAGLAQNVVVDGASLRLGQEADDRGLADGPGRRSGLYTSPPHRAAAPFDRLAGRLNAVQPAGSTLEAEARVAEDGGAWTAWLPLPPDGSPLALPGRVRWLQYRLALAAAPELPGPEVRSVEIEAASSGVVAALASAVEQHPTARLFAVRQGLVGRRTANGHVIRERDRFASLPSRRALNVDGGRDYQVRLSYKGRSATAPVWDVGPWNTKDNYWDASREMWTDLPRFVPQAAAAYLNGHNGGRDERGRQVTHPSGVELADGTFWDDLGMVESDWVEVTFLWVGAPSPSPAAVPETSGSAPRPPSEAAPQGQPALPAEVRPPGRRWYLAEASTREPFETWILLQNPGDQPATVDLTYALVGGSDQQQRVQVPPTSRLSIFANQVVGQAEFSARVDADRAIFAEQSTYFRRGGSAATAVAQPSAAWYLPEGSTQPPFDTWILVHNPDDLAATVTLRLFPEAGQEVAHSFEVAAHGRRAVLASELLRNAAFATRVEASVPVLVERQMSLGADRGGATFGAAAPSPAWYFGEGDTTGGRDTWLLLQNPSDTPANVQVSYLLESGQPVERRYGVAPNSRLSVYANAVLEPTRFGMSISADVPIVAERAVYFGKGTEGRPTGGHATLGSPRLARVWYLPEGATTYPFQEQVLIANPNAEAASVRLDLVQDNSSTVGQSYALAPHARLSVDVGTIAPNAAVSARVTASLPVVVERTLGLYGGEGASNTVGVPWEG